MRHKKAFRRAVLGRAFLAESAETLVMFGGEKTTFRSADQDADIFRTCLRRGQGCPRSFPLFSLPVLLLSPPFLKPQVDGGIKRGHVCPHLTPHRDRRQGQQGRHAGSPYFPPSWRLSSPRLPIRCIRFLMVAGVKSGRTLATSAGPSGSDRTAPRMSSPS